MLGAKNHRGALMNATQKTYRVLVVDDHDVVRRGVRALLESQPGVEVCSEAGTGLEAVDYVKKSKPDLVVLDLTMPDMNGLDAARVIRETSPETEVLILSMHFSEEIAREILRLGARGYLMKSDANTELIAAVQLLAEGKSNKETAAALGVSTRTVESHRNHIMHKISFTSFSDLIRFAFP